MYSKVKVSRDRPRWPQGVPCRLRPRIFLTFRHYKGGRSSAKSTGRLYLRINPWYSLSEAESTSGHMVLSGEPRKKSPVTPPGIDPGTVRLVAQCLNHYATPGPKYVVQIEINYKEWVVNDDLCIFFPCLYEFTTRCVQLSLFPIFASKHVNIKALRFILLVLPSLETII
jgi:hypothetical protein